MQTALMSKTNRKNRIERQCSMYGVCMYVCLYVWADGCTVCMCVHVSLNICLCVHDTVTSEYI